MQATEYEALAAAPPILRAILRGIDRLGRLDGWIGSLCLAALTILMIAEVVTRALSNIIPSLPAGIPVAWEYSSYLMAATFTFGAAMTLRAGAHIRVSLVLGQLQGRTLRVVECLLSMLATAFVGYLALAMASFTLEAFSHGRTSQTSGTQIWLPAAAIGFGLALLALQFLARAIQGALGLPLEDLRMRSGSYVE